MSGKINLAEEAAVFMAGDTSIGQFNHSALFKHEATIPDSPTTSRSDCSTKHFVPVKVMVVVNVEDATSERLDSMEDCEVRDEDEEMHNNCINIGPYNRRSNENLAIRSSLQSASTSQFKHNVSESKLFQGLGTKQNVVAHRR